MRRPLTRAANAPILEISEVYGKRQQYVSVNNIVPHETDLDCLAVVDVQLGLHHDMAADSLHVNFVCCDGSVQIGTDVTTRTDMQELRQYVRGKNRTLRSIHFEALGSISLSYIKEDMPLLKMTWDKNHTDLIPKAASAITDIHRYELGGTAADIVHGIWMAVASYRSFYD